MLRKTMLSKILSTAIAAITVVSPLGVSANPTSSQGDEKNNPETTTVSSQENFANPNLIPLPVSARKRKSTEPISCPPPEKKTKLESPYKVVISFDNSNEKKPRILIKFICTISNPTKEQKDLMEKFCEEIMKIFNFKAYVPGDITNSIMIVNKILSVNRIKEYMDILETVISYTSERHFNNNFNNINILN